MVNKKKPLVSAIVSTYNSEKFIRGKIEDLLQQTIIDRLEIIIVNSGSQQNEDAIIKEYIEKWSNIKYIRTEERETIYKAWNRGIKIASGEFITNANTDDRLKKEAYEELSKYLLNNSEICLVYADQYIVKSVDEKNLKDLYIFPDYDKMLQFERCLVGSQPMWRSSLHFKDNIWFDENLEVCGDYEFQLRITQKYCIQHVEKALGTFFKSPKKTNKEYQNAELTLNENNYVRNKYIKLYIQSLQEDQLFTLLKRFKLYIKLPIKVFLMQYWLKRWFFGIQTPTFESIYIFSIYILLFKNRKEEAKKICELLLQKKFIKRIKDIYETENWDRNNYL